MAPLDDVAKQAVDRAVLDLMADHERQGGRLSQDQVERLLDKRNLGSTGSLAVYQLLSENGIDISDDAELPPQADRLVAESDRSIRPGAPIFSAALAHPTLSPPEEIELGRRIELARKLESELSAKASDPTPEAAKILRRADEARLKFVLHNIRLVHSIARRHAGISNMAISDLLQEGIIGLMRAVEMFDHTRGFKFSTYATWWIRQAITRVITDRGPTIRLPVHLAEKITKLKRAERRLAQSTGARPSTQDIADELDWKPERVAQLQAVSRIGVVSLDASKDEDKGVGAIIDATPADTPDPEEIAMTRALAVSVRHALETLNPREKVVLRQRFGLDDGNPKTLEQIGEQFNVTRERIRQIEKKALQHLRHPLRLRALKAFMDYD